MQAIVMHHSMSTLELYSVTFDQLEFSLTIARNGDLERVRSH